MESKAYIEYFHYDSRITEVDMLITDPLSRIKDWSVGGLLGYKDDNKKTNLERMYSLYKFDDYPDESKEQFEINKTSDITTISSMMENQLPSFIPKYNKLKLGTALMIPQSRIQTGIDITRNTEIIKEEYPFVVVDAVKKIIRDSRGTYKHRSYEDNTVYIRVFVYSKALAVSNDSIDGKLINISQFINSVNINKSKSAGSFNIVMSPIPAKHIDGHWEIDVEDRLYSDLIMSVDAFNISMRSGEYIGNVISDRDVVFISLTQQDDSSLKFDMNDIVIGEDILGKMSFDMIGIVNTITRPYIAGSGEVRLDVSGEDLMSLLNTDGSGIHAQRYISSGKMYEDVDYNSGLVRFRGQYVSQLQLKDLSVKDQILFVIDYMSKTKLCKSSLFSFIENKRKLKMSAQDVVLVPLPVENIWSIVDVVVDDEASKRRAFNANVGNSFNPLISQIRNICIEPFVEFYGDTLGNKYYLIARKSPYTKKAIEYYIDNDMTIIIDDSDISEEALQYDTRVYTWYKIDNKFIYNVFGEDMKWLIPAIMFEEYADIWGDRPYRVANPYIDMSMKADNGEDDVLGRKMIQQSLEDIRRIISCNAYLPFSRTGKLTIRGRRGIRVGMSLFNRSTGEIFHVQAVSNSAAVGENITNSTTVSVDRGIVVDDLDKYFSIIDMKINDLKKDEDAATYINDTLRSWKVNKDVFKDMRNKVMVNRGGVRV